MLTECGSGLQLIRESPRIGAGRVISGTRPAIFANHLTFWRVPMTSETDDTTNNTLKLEDIVKAQGVMIKSIILLLDTRFSEPKFSDLLRNSFATLAEDESAAAGPAYLRALHSMLPPRAQ
jgi:hypothetical protein